MPRRPDLTKAMLWAGLICLWVCLLGPTGSRAEMRAPVRAVQAENRGATVSSPSSRPAAQESSPQKPTPSRHLVCPPSFGGSAILQWISGGFLGSFVCYYAYGYPLRYVWHEVWPPGLLDLLMLVAFCFLGIRIYLKVSRPQQPETKIQPGFLRLGSEAPPPISITEGAKLGLAAIQESDSGFDLQAFGEELRLLLVQLYQAWNREDLYGLNGKVKEGLLEYLQMGLKIMFLREERSHLESLTLESVTVTAAGVNDGRDFITVCFHGRLLDYVLDKSSGKLLLGSMAYPSTFLEYWDLERIRGQGTWVLQDIRET